MFQNLVQMIKKTVQSPQDGMTDVVAIDMRRNELWMALAIIALMSAILSKLAELVIRSQQTSVEMAFVQPPVVLAVMVFVALVLMVFCTHYVGQMFGGTGAFDDSIKIIIWLQAVLIPFQLLQLIILMFSPVGGALLGYAAGFFGVWLYVNFVALVHGFNSLGLVFAGMLVALFGIAFGLGILLSFVAVLFGLEIGNA